ncbi:hypothetical protein ACFQ1M_00385 [Sungkyunkwania multivorans]|uniref:Secretion system C-terminal sorting domain-containing protein n=1 Tax=Sungkyunkwania multivorans TaxID=1173618 RepID=A0ABW3CSA9_9FLAO
MKSLVSLGLLFLSSVLFAQKQTDFHKIFNLESKKVQKTLVYTLKKEVAFTFSIKDVNGEEILSRLHPLGSTRYVKISLKKLVPGKYYVVLTDGDGAELYKEKFEKL